MLTLLAASLFGSLGIWQLGRAGEKRAIFAAYALGTTGTLQEGLGGANAGEQRYQLLRLQGHYDSGHQVLLDNMSHVGRSGYQVLTPFITAGGSVMRDHAPPGRNRK